MNVMIYLLMDIQTHNYTLIFFSITFLLHEFTRCSLLISFMYRIKIVETEDMCILLNVTNNCAFRGLFM